MVEKELLRIMDHNFSLMDKFINETKDDIHKVYLTVDELQKAIAKNQKYCKKLNYFLYGSLAIGVIALVRSASTKRQFSELKERIEMLENKKGA